MAGLASGCGATSVVVAVVAVVAGLGSEAVVLAAIGAVYGGGLGLIAGLLAGVIAEIVEWQVTTTPSTYGAVAAGSTGLVALVVTGDVARAVTPFDASGFESIIWALALCVLPTATVVGVAWWVGRRVWAGVRPRPAPIAPAHVATNMP